MYGGYVAWNKGEREDGSDSIAEQVAPDSHWPDIEVIILVVSDNKKPISSTSGMKTSVQTSSLLQYRAEAIVPYRMDQMREAILNRDFRTFAELTMKVKSESYQIRNIYKLFEVL
jgi:diphosphomevalonate decarboxylase